MTQPAAIVIHQDFPAGGPLQFLQDRNYLLYARRGVVSLEQEGRRWSLPPARAALIAARQPITVILPQPVAALSVLFRTDFMPEPAQSLSVFDMSSLARALLHEAKAWPDGPDDDYSTRLFDTLSMVVLRLAEAPLPVHRPTGRSDLVRKALDITEARMEAPPTFEALAAELAATPRTLARHILAETGATWRGNLRRMRILRAMELLAMPDSSVTQAAFATGYSSLSAFNAAFREMIDLTPTEYRRSLA